MAREREQKSNFCDLCDVKADSKIIEQLKARKRGFEPVELVLALKNDKERKISSDR